jgi:hypothetical protein
MIECIHTCRALGDACGVGEALNNLGLVKMAQEDLAPARELISESLRTKRQLGDRRGISSSLSHFAMIAARSGDAERDARSPQSSGKSKSAGPGRPSRRHIAST